MKDIVFNIIFAIGILLIAIPIFYFLWQLHWAAFMIVLGLCLVGIGDGLCGGSYR